jgi:hypothetical protein
MLVFARPVWNSNHVIHTLGSFIECSTDNHVRDFVYFDALLVLFPWPFKKRLRTSKSSCGAVDGIAFCEEEIAKDAGDISVDAGD